MLCWFRKKSLRVPRLALMLMLAPALLAQSFIELSGQTHEAVLHADAGEAYTPHLSGHDHHTSDPAGNDHDGGGALHMLLHQSCGGHCFWVAATLASPVLTDAPATAIAVESAPPLPRSDYAAPFRPPIQA